MSNGIAIELFGCAGGVGEGARRAGVTFDWVFDYSKDACDSYAANLGHRPVQMDVRDLVRLARGGWRPAQKIWLLSGDPPCVPWSRAGKRQGLDDERDMLRETVELISIWQPENYLIGNVPGLDDSRSWPIVQDVIGGLTRHGYCVRDFMVLEASELGVPQRRIRPWWFGHRDGPCLVPPARTHCNPDELHTMTMPGVEPLKPWVTCRDALGHLSQKDLGRPVRLRYRHTTRAGKLARASERDRSAGTVTVRENGDGNQLALETRQMPSNSRRGLPSSANKPSRTVRAGSHADIVTSHDQSHAIQDADRPARTITQNTHSDGALLVDDPKHPILTLDRPSTTLRGGGDGHSAPQAVISLDASNERFRRPSRIDDPVRCVTAGDGTNGNKMLEWPWSVPSTTVTTRAAIPPPGHHPESGSILSMPGAVVLSELAITILQGFPEDWKWCGKTKTSRQAMRGMATPPAMAEAIFRQIVKREQTR